MKKGQSRFQGSRSIVCSRWTPIPETHRYPISQLCKTALLKTTSPPIMPCTDTVDGLCIDKSVRDIKHRDRVGIGAQVSVCLKCVLQGREQKLLPRRGEQVRF